MPLFDESFARYSVFNKLQMILSDKFEYSMDFDVKTDVYNFLNVSLQIGSDVVDIDLPNSSIASLTPSGSSNILITLIVKFGLLFFEQFSVCALSECTSTCYHYQLNIPMISCYFCAYQSG